MRTKWKPSSCRRRALLSLVLMTGVGCVQAESKKIQTDPERSSQSESSTMRSGSSASTTDDNSYRSDNSTRRSDGYGDRSGTSARTPNGYLANTERSDTRTTDTGKRLGTSASRPMDSSDRSDTSSDISADDQGSSDSEVELTRKIRRELTKNSDLSSSARNIKVITKNREVTLKGPVRNESERKTVAAIAESVAGDARVRDEMSVSR